eukprot:CAMPEP_0206518402 /NCGR_PEP_ID=MMETSP0324_2-20121206/64555_1 /ASSEMBLY_ACC=CAM_ASM_000836 /TAXON_ID=2866 /ORGANISM="Crypthecodinium cohnii, Strain Seligo" /LENGTH=402 /DNA_ID=CAMNT_0054011747 /DNA_START=20 /DNA_END=1225 /DNA_ORIENTATION=-
MRPLLILSFCTLVQTASGLLSRLGATTAPPSSENPAAAAILQDTFTPTFVAPQLTPVQFLFLSSPAQKKVVYSELRNFKSTYGRTFPLIEEDLVEPAGIAYDNTKGHLYVADRGASRIYRYKILSKEVGSGSEKRAGVAGTNSVNKIEHDVLKKLGEGIYQCGDLKKASESSLLAKPEKELEADIALDASQRASEVPTDDDDTEPEILSLYEGSLESHVSVPSGVSSDGRRLWWGNGVEGRTAGSLVEGQAAPRASLLASGSSSSQPFPAVALTSVVPTTYGVAHSNTMVFFSTNQTGTGSVYAVSRDGSTTELVSGLGMPRGLVWDGDNTVYVADQAANKVFSVPVGRFMDNAPIEQSVFAKASSVWLFEQKIRESAPRLPTARELNPLRAREVSNLFYPA